MSSQVVAQARCTVTVVKAAQADTPGDRAAARDDLLFDGATVGVTMWGMSAPAEERRFARWICRDCRSARFATIPRDGFLKCPICYAAVRFDPKRHARRDPSDRGKRPEEIPPRA